MLKTLTRVSPSFFFFSLAAVYGQTFSGFTPGNVVVSRSVYSGTAASLSVG